MTGEGRMTRAAMRLALGGLILLVAAAVGVVVGFEASLNAWFALNLHFMARRTIPPPWLSSLVPSPIVVIGAGMVLGAVGGVFLGVWLIRRLFGARPARS